MASVLNDLSDAGFLPFGRDMAQERRRDIRARIVFPVDMIRGAEAEPIEVVNASHRGLLVRVHEALPMMRLVRLRLHLPTRDVDTHAVVMRIDGRCLDGRWELGLRFFALNGLEQRDWERFVTAQLRIPVAA